jgi:hypothetical protein
LHELKAAPEIGADMAADKNKAVGQRAALVAQAPVDGFGILIAKRLDDHEQHATPPKSRRRLPVR